ncbi:MAG: hypothetical protein GY754_33020 [bacterium]|nr:hypothetical protein [bacterium]
MNRPKNISKHLLISFALGVLFSVSTGAEEKANKISLSDFIGTAKKDFALVANKEKNSYLSKAGGNTPFIGNVELRGGVDEMDLEKQKYSLRVNPLGWGETESQGRLCAGTKNFYRTQKEILLSTALKDRYLLALDLVHQEKLLGINKKLLAIHSDIVTVYNSRAKSTGFNIGDLVKARQDLSRLKLDILDLENSNKKAASHIAAYLDRKGPVLFNTASFVSEKELKERVSGNSFSIDNKNIFLAHNRNLVKLKKGKLDYEISEGRRYLSFVELSYETKNSFSSRENYSVQMGLTLPFVSSGTLKINSRKLSLIEEKRKLRKLKWDLERNSGIIKHDMNTLFRQYELLSPEPGKANPAAPYLKLEGIDPMTVLLVKKKSVELELSLENTRHTLFTRYVDLLEISGYLVKKPLKNYLLSGSREL